MQRRSTLVANQDCKFEEQVQGGTDSRREKVKKAKLGHTAVVLVFKPKCLTVYQSSGGSVAGYARRNFEKLLEAPIMKLVRRDLT